jgi:hypothetical protein
MYLLKAVISLSIQRLLFINNINLFHRANAQETLQFNLSVSGVAQDLK